MEETPKKSALKKTGSILYHTLLPIAAIRTSVKLVRKEVAIHKDNIQRIKSLKDEASESLSSQREVKNDSFTDAVGTDEEHIKQLQNSFVQQKKYYLIFGVVFLIFESLMLVISLIKQDLSATFFLFMSVLITVLLTFIAMMGKQLRIWQLKTRRLSIEEKGGFDSFVKENPDWIKLTLSLKGL
ncbi:hypothetical protein L292_3172 [Acinetobacter junii CIP 107470 = MTCC 11364]|uniref:Uncharacterized protein n=1 Tax=Acinetobacter junii CIP 107470 = MTCC 11364 TaxID=1217666 RepID=S7WV57_ACIJU|nr:hypothetical protein [Acinetobacter junii]ENV52031.1 hypothetical protein F953_00521 [Acinetobacter junii CIP 107470 = MTCC 11364]EPR85842.1 hypothetical protein L292_3172 [Acinetobacter junii CIP 107470 = MTCC 11364]